MIVQDLASFKNPEGFRGRSAFIVQLWWIVEACLFRPSPQFLYGWRRWLLRMFGADIGKQVLLRPDLQVTYPWKLTIGDHSWVGNGTKLYTLAPITLGANVAIGQDVHLITGSHDFRKSTFDIYADPIVIEDESWICNDVFIHAGVRVGRGSVVGARAVVRRDTEPYSINIGAPARSVGDRREGKTA